MEPFPTCHCCSSCMHRALWKGGCLGWAGQWKGADVGLGSLQKIQVSLTFAQMGEPEKVEQHEVRRGEEAAVGEKEGRGCM